MANAIKKLGKKGVLRVGPADSFPGPGPMMERLTAEVAGNAPCSYFGGEIPVLCEKKYSIGLSFYALLPIVLARNNDYS